MSDLQLRMTHRGLAYVSKDPTADAALASTARTGSKQQSAPPPPDREWIPQLYRQYGNLRVVAGISGLPVARVKAILAEAGEGKHKQKRAHKNA